MTKFRRLLAQQYGTPLTGAEFGFLAACVCFAVAAMILLAAFVAALF